MQLLTTALSILLVCSADASAQVKQQPTPVKPGAAMYADVKAKSPNAADIYLLAIEELRKALHDPTKALSDPAGDFLGLPVEAAAQIEDPSNQLWCDAVTKSAVAITLFAQASQISRCEFDRYPKELATGLTRQLNDFGIMLKVMTAHGWQQSKRAPTSAVMTGLKMLRYADHCVQDRSLLGVALGLHAEERAASLLEAAISELATQEQAEVNADRLLKQLEACLNRRLSNAVIADVAEHDFAFHLENGLGEEAHKNPDLSWAVKRAKGIMRELFEPLRQKPAMPIELFRVRWSRRIDSLKEIRKGENMDDFLATGSGEPLAAVLVLLACVPPSQLLEMCHANAAVLQSCAGDLRKIARGN